MGGWGVKTLAVILVSDLLVSFGVLKFRKTKKVTFGRMEGWRSEHYTEKNREKKKKRRD